MYWHDKNCHVGVFNMENHVTHLVGVVVFCHPTKGCLIRLNLRKS